MSHAPAPASPWSRVLPSLQIAIDAHSLEAFKTCPRYYQNRVIRGRITPRANDHLTFGILFGQALEVAERLRAQCECWGEDPKALQRQVFRWALVASSRWQSVEPTKTRQTLLRSVVWYLERYREDPLRTVILPNGDPAVELGFQFDLGIQTSTTGETWALCGYLDRLVLYNGRPAIVDIKTTRGELNETFFEAFSPHTQMSAYDVAGQVILPEPISNDIVIDGVQVLVNSTRFRRGYTARNAEARRAWLKDLEFWLRQMERTALEYGDSPWPQNEHSCFGCPYRRPCRESSPEIEAFILERDFVERHWNPLAPRHAGRLEPQGADTQ